MTDRNLWSWLEWVWLILLGAGLGLLAAHFHLLDSWPAVIALGVVVLTLIAAGLRASLHLWDDLDD